VLDNLIEIEKDAIFDKTGILKLHDYRFVALSCEKQGEKYELTYHFDVNYELKHLRILVNTYDNIKSISTIYPAAFLIENEYQDLYGFEFTNLTVNYKGNLYLAKSAPKAPWAIKNEA
jgi:ech hydrogenase subunit D